MLKSAPPSELIFITDPRILAVPVQDNQEAMISLKQQTDLQYGPSPEIPNNQDYTQMRKTVYEKLRLAQTFLPTGIKFCLYEAYRSLALQKFLFDTRYQKVQQAFEHFTAEQLFIETTRLVSPIHHLDGSLNIPPHATGAAVDVYLIDENNQALDMGIHPQDWMTDVDGQLSLTHSSLISAAAKHNRELMSQALQEVGFVNYPTEYWHWSFGDRYWAYHSHSPCAIYGLINR